MQNFKQIQVDKLKKAFFFSILSNNLIHFFCHFVLNLKVTHKSYLSQADLLSRWLTRTAKSIAGLINNCQIVWENWFLKAIELYIFWIIAHFWLDSGQNWKFRLDIQTKVSTYAFKSLTICSCFSVKNQMYTFEKILFKKYKRTFLLQTFFETLFF